MTKIQKCLTFSDLLDFCQLHNFTTFSSKKYGYNLAVQIPTSFEVQEFEDNNHRGMMRLKFRILHDGVNRNGSYVPHESAQEAASTIADRPIMAAIHQLDDGSWDFEGHEIEIIEGDDGEEETIYIEKQVGSFSSEEPFWEYDKETGKNYLCAYGYIAEEYTKAPDIIRQKGWTKNSCELNIEEMTYNAKEKCLSLDKFYLSASTLLGSRKDGTKINEGMLGARADIADFSDVNNSIQFETDEKIKEIIRAIVKETLNNTASFAEKNIERKEDKVELNKELFNELLVKYNKTEADITFDYSELDDDALSAAFAEAFENEENSSSEGENNTDSKDAENKNAEGVESQFDGDGNGDSNGDNTNTEITDLPENTTETPTENPSENPTTEPVTEPATEPTTEPVTEPTTDPVVNPVVTNPVQDDEEHHNTDDGSDAEYLKKIQNNEIQFAATFKGETKTFSKSLNEVINSLYELVNATYGESDNDFYDVEVFDDKKVQFYGWFTGKNYRQSYKEKDGVYSLKGDRVELFARYLTQEECDALDNLQHNFEEVSEKLAKYEAEPEKMSILESKDYASIAESDEFIAFKSQDAHFDLSVDEVRAKADKMLLDAAKAGKVEFSKKETEKKHTFGFKGFPVNTTKKGIRKYGNMLQGI